MGLDSKIIDSLEDIIKGRVLRDAPLSAWTTLRVGGPTDALVQVNAARELQAVLALCHEHKIKWDILGKGSNVLASDDGYQGIIIILGKGFRHLSTTAQDSTSVHVRIGAAASLARVGEWAMERGYSGFEFAAGIPGTIGGALRMNAGAWGHDIGALVRSVELVDQEQRKILSSEKLRFEYRCWHDLKTRLSGSVITAVTIELAISESTTIQQKMREYQRKRKELQPVGVPSAGSFFKNPEDKSAGQLIDEAGLKGVHIGDAEVSEKHANFLVNRGRATAQEIIELMHLVQRQVQKDSNILLEPEVYFLQ